MMNCSGLSSKSSSFRKGPSVQRKRKLFLPDDNGSSSDFEKNDDYHYLINCNELIRTCKVCSYRMAIELNNVLTCPFLD